MSHFVRNLNDRSLLARNLIDESPFVKSLYDGSFGRAVLLGAIKNLHALK